MELSPPQRRLTSSNRVNDDAQLVEATLAGNTSAFGQLVERYQDRLYNTVTRFLGSSEDARDVVQDAFVQAFVKLESFRGASTFYTWLYRIAFNLAMSFARKKRSSLSLDQARDEFGSEPMDAQGGPDASVLQNERANLVHTALGTLGDEYRQVIVLRELEGCAYEQIAEILDLPVGTVRSRLFRARLQLRDRLAPMIRDHIEEPT